MKTTPSRVVFFLVLFLTLVTCLSFFLCKFANSIVMEYE